MKVRKFDDYLYEKLRDPDYAVAYVETALEDGVEEFLYALRKVAVAQGGVRKVAEESQKGRESLYKSLSREGNPRLRTLDDVLHALGMRLAVTRDAAASQTEADHAQAAVHA